MADTTFTIEQEIAEDLKEELSETDELFNEKVMLSKIRSAIREVKRARNYPDSYTDEMIESDISNYYTNIRNLALYDYNSVGSEGEQSHSENGVNFSYVDRAKMLAGVTPLARVI